MHRECLAGQCYTENSMKTMERQKGGQAKKATLLCTIPGSHRAREHAAVLRCLPMAAGAP